MVIQTSNATFLIEESQMSDGSLLVYADNDFELQRLFSNAQVLDATGSGWKFLAVTCRQELANVLIHLVKEIDYQNFFQSKEEIH
jgi:hypothetical protein